MLPLASSAIAPLAAAILTLHAPPQPPLAPAAVVVPPTLHGGGDGGVAGGARTFHVQGRIAYSRVVEASPALVGAARVRVELWDQDDLGDELMASAETDMQGFYDITVEWDDCDITGCDDPDLYVVFRTINAEHDVQRDSVLQATYAWSSEDNALEDVTATEVNMGTITPAPAEEQGAVHVHTVLSFARAALEPTGIGFTFPLLECDWSATSTDTELDDTRLSLAGDDGWSEAVVGREYLLFFFEQRYNEPIGNLCNGICDDDGCSACLWCIEAPEAAWRLGCSIWFGDALGRSMTATTGAPPLDTVPEIDAVFPCPDGLPVEPAWVPGYVAAILRDLEDGIELLDVDGDGSDDAPPESACERDSLSRGLEDVAFDVFFTPHDDIDDFVAFEQANATDPAALWRTLRRIAGDRWTAPDVAPPVITSVASPTHPGGIGSTPVAEVVLFAGDAASGVAGFSLVWATTSATVDTTVDLVASPVGPTLLSSPQIPYGSQLYLSIRAVDCVGQWSQTVAIGPFVVADCDEDGIPDLCACGACDEWPGYCPPETCGIVDDCNGNLVPDECDIAGGVIDDCNLDGIDDACQATTNSFEPPPGSSALWNVASSWSNGTLPNASELACLRLGDPLFVTQLSGLPATVFAFGCDHTLLVSSTLTAAAESRSARIDLTAGTLTGSGDVIASDLRWTSGTVGSSAGSDPTLIAGTLTTIGNASKQLQRDTLIVAQLQHNAGSFALSNGAVLTLGLGSVSTLAGGTSIVWSTGAQPTLAVDGELRKTGSGLAQMQQVPMLMNGRLVVDAGELSVADVQLNGPTEIAAGATLRMASGTAVVSPAASIVGGRLETTLGSKTLDGLIDVDESVLSGATVSLAPSLDMTSGSLALTSGSLGGAGDATVGSLAWSGGAMSGAGAIMTGDLSITGSSQKNLSRSLSVSGEATYSGAGVGVSEGGTLSIEPGSTFSITGDGGFVWITGGQPGTVVNHGVLRKAGTAGTSQFSLVGLTNHGLVSVETGTLRFTGSSSHDGSMFGLNGTALEFLGGTHSFGSASVIDAGTFAVGGGTVSLAGLFESDLLQMTGGTLQFTESANAEASAMALSSGTLAGSGDLTVSGGLQWLSGVMEGAGTTTLLGDALLTTASQKVLRRPLTTHGVFRLSGGTLGVDAGAVLEVERGGEFAMDGGATATWISGPNPGSILVRGTLRKSADAGTATVNFATLVAEGAIAIDGGVLHLTAPLLVSGDVTSAPGAELRLTGSNQQVIGPGGTVDVSSLRLSGSAVILNAPVEADAAFVENGTTNVNGAFAAGTLTLSSGTVGGSGAMSASGLTTLLGTTLAGTGTLDLLGPVAIQGVGAKNVVRTVRQHGAATWTQGNVGLSSSANGSGLWHLLPGSSLDIVGNGLSMIWISGSAPGAMLNEGTIRSTAGSGTTSVNFVGFTNGGTLDIGGPLWRHTSGSSFLQTAGMTLVRSGCELEHPGTIDVAAGTLSGSGRVDANVSLGTATIRPGDAIGTLTIEGSATFSTGSSLGLSIASAEQDRLSVLGPATLAGTVLVSLEGDFVPAIGDSFVILTCTARTGTFSGATAITPLPTDRRWALQHNPTNVTLVVVPALPCPGDLDLDASVGPTDLALLLGAWGTDGVLSGADLNEDGTVSAPDLAILLGAWGPCPTTDANDAADGDRVMGGVAAAPTLNPSTPSDSEQAGRHRLGERERLRGREDASRVTSERERIVALVRDADGATPTWIEGDLAIPGDATVDRLITTLLPDGDECSLDGALLVVEGEAHLDGTLRITIDDALDIEADVCIRILVAAEVTGTPSIEVLHRGISIPVEVLLGATTVDIRLRREE